MKQDVQEKLEQYMIMGMIVSNDYMRSIRKLYNPRYFKSSTAKLIATWCIEYFDEYGKVPFMEIQAIFFTKMKEGLRKEIGEEIEAEILPQLSTKYEEEENYNYQYWVDQTKDYFREQHLIIYADSIKATLSLSGVDEAERTVNDYKRISVQASTGLDLDSEEAVLKLEQAFDEAESPLIHYPWALGTMMNDQLVRGSFVALLAPEKRGKSFKLLDMAIRGLRENRNIAFFQAGDMTEKQQLLRMAIYLTQTPRKEKYCGPRMQTVADCYYNQIDQCKRKDRFCNFGVVDDEELGVQKYQEKLEYNRLQSLYDQYPEYVPCTNLACGVWEKEGALWLKPDFVHGPLTKEKAVQTFSRFIKNQHSKFKMSTHPGDLTLDKMNTLLDMWAMDEGFIPDVILVDYADLVKPKKEAEFRHRQNEVWEGFRQLTFEKHCLLVTATQADAKSYDNNTLKLSNFSEDKRKYAHVTAFFGLNQDPKGREKKLGILRVNELLLREDDFEINRQVKVLQDLSRGRPVLKSFF